MLADYYGARKRLNKKHVQQHSAKGVATCFEHYLIYCRWERKVHEVYFTDEMRQFCWLALNLFATVIVGCKFFYAARGKTD